MQNSEELPGDASIKSFSGRQTPRSGSKAEQVKGVAPEKKAQHRKSEQKAWNEMLLAIWTALECSQAGYTTAKFGIFSRFKPRRLP